MSDYPASTVPPNITIHPYSLESIGIGLFAMSITTAASLVWPTANLALFIPFVLLEPITVKQFLWYNGLTIAGNVDVGVYDKEGNLLGAVGGVAHAGAGVTQSSDPADFTCGPGLFYLAMVMTDATAKVYQTVPVAGMTEALGMFQMAAAYPLPAVATFAICTTNAVPLVALTTRTLI